MNNRNHHTDRNRDNGSRRRKHPANRSKQGNSGRRPRHAKDKLNGSAQRLRPEPGSDQLSAFELFCSLYLGITPEGQFRAQKPPEVGQRFDLSAFELDAKMVEFGLDHDTLRRSGFDMTLAKYDIRVAPEGISRRELAKPWFDELREAVHKIRPDLLETAQKRKEEKEEMVAEPKTAAGGEALKSPIFDD